MKKVKVLKFEKDGCIPCKIVGEFLAKEGINVDESYNPFDNPDIARKHRVMSVPKTVFFVNDEVVFEFNGADITNLNKLSELYKEHNV